MNKNPFSVSSPEAMTAEEMHRLFVPLSENFEIEDIGHVFIHGQRGSGKSMMLRLLAPDCKMIANKCEINELPYLGVYATIKSEGLDLTEFDRIKNQFAGSILAEHSLCLFLASKIMLSLRDHSGGKLTGTEAQSELKCFINTYIFSPLGVSTSDGECFPSLAIKAIDVKYSEFTDYMRLLSLEDKYIPFIKKIVGYRDFLYPFCENLTSLSCLPKGKPLYILLDDADNLNAMQTQVLNTWVSYRSGGKVSFKISTQLHYKHYRTATNQRIESPHDFKEVNISTIHTGYTGGSSKDGFSRWVKDIVSKRLQAHGINVETKAFFPEDEKQVSAIKKISDNLRSRWETEGTGFRASDDAYRYARPDYIKSLGGISKNSSNYSYSGFDQLVHLSSGIIRYFLNDAASMYAEEMKLSAKNQDILAEFIRPKIQDKIVRASADALMIDNLDKLSADANQNQGSYNSETKNEFKKLNNIIQSLGGIFQEILFSNRSERRVFTIALSDTPPDEIMRILKLGVEHGYLYEGTLGTKDGYARTRRFVLTRRLAPQFKLDPTGFSGYLFVTTDQLQNFIQNPAKAIKNFVDNRLARLDDEPEAQLSLELFP